MDSQQYSNLKMGEKGAILSIVTYLFLSGMKLLIGILTGSEALYADGLNNSTDIIASIAVLIGLKLSQRPPDSDHGYGHWKSETIASLIASLIMMVVGIQVLLNGFGSMFEGHEEAPDILAAYVGIFSFIIMYLVYRYNKHLAEKINSQSVMAAAKDNLSDAWVSIGTSAGIFGSQLGMPWLDTVTALLVGLLICKTAWDIFREASHHLSDGFDEEKIALYEKSIMELEDVRGVKEIKGRNYGNNEVIDIVIYVNSSLNIQEAHDIATLVEKELTKKFGVYNVHVHVEPYTVD
ncbi:transporter [Pradoshia eiseniae]|uniref:Transporter n=1 Tax=Pradoshia eiseniae TaxID=2064768 RepID=A0A2S7MYC9_9BACI|nr:cation diffusion facilitator family transporter [Pradoshia eiseniae]PQD94811.1 transporter [Pradoshia eiseniae]